MTVRQLAVEVLTLAQDTETEWTVPAGLYKFELKPDTEAEIRMGFSAGSTATSGAYWPFSPDWWADYPTKLPAGSKVYFRCVSTANVLRILYGVD